MLFVVSARPSIFSSTSKSLSASGFALTLIWMLIFGCCCCCCSERGAFGFSNDRSFTYCASTLSCGGAWLESIAPAGGPPLVDAMNYPPASACPARSAVWLTHASKGDKQADSSIRSGRWLVREALFRHPPPLVGRQVDQIGAAACAVHARDGAAQRRTEQMLRQRQQQQQPQQVRQKARQRQQQSAQHGEKAAAIEFLASNGALAEIGRAHV